MHQSCDLRQERIDTNALTAVTRCPVSLPPKNRNHLRTKAGLLTYASTLPSAFPPFPAVACSEESLGIYSGGTAPDLHRTSLLSGFQHWNPHLYPMTYEIAILIIISSIGGHVYTKLPLSLKNCRRPPVTAALRFLHSSHLLPRGSHRLFSRS